MQLVIDELVGDISPEDDRMYRQLLREDPAAATLRDDVIKLLTEGDMQGVLEDKLSLEHALKKLKAQKTKKRNRFFRGPGAVIILFLLIVTGIFSVRYQQQATKSKNTTDLQAILYKYPLLMFSDESFIRLDAVTVNREPNITSDEQHKTFHIKGPINHFNEATLISARGESYKLILPDGTDIYVDGKTSVTFFCHRPVSHREIAVSGQVFIKAAHDPKRPFVINLPQEGKVSVLGTSFNVNTDEKGHLQVALKDGKVNVQNGKRIATLDPGFAASWQKGKEISKKKFDEEEVLSWLKGRHSCVNATLRDMAYILERRYPYKVSIDVPSAEDTSHFISGQMDRDISIEDFLTMAVTYPTHDKFRYHFDKDSVFHISLTQPRN